MSSNQTSKKPSEKIWDRYKFLRGTGGDDAMSYCEAIVQYLDEEHEKNNPIQEHENNCRCRDCYPI